MLKFHQKWTAYSFLFMVTNCLATDFITIHLRADNSQTMYVGRMDNYEPVNRDVNFSTGSLDAATQTQTDILHKDSFEGIALWRIFFDPNDSPTPVWVSAECENVPSLVVANSAVETYQLHLINCTIVPNVPVN